MKSMNYLMLFLLPLFFGCSSTLPIKTVRDQGDTSIDISDGTEEEKKAPPPKQTTPTADVTAPKTDETSEVKTDPASSAVIHKEIVKLSDLELQKFAYELGLDPKENLSEAEKKQILDRKKVRELERSLDSQKEREQYSKVLPWLKNDAEKIKLLSIPSLEGRQVWINKNKIWSRSKNLAEFDAVVEQQDIAIGMPAEYVIRSWGEPSTIETSGNPIYRNERWQYNRQISTPQGYKQERRFVYFEGGRVVGWETE